MKLIAVMGVTNVGKSTLMDSLDALEGVGKIEVGKELRRRHPPEYFQGKAAMEHTEDEVWDIFEEQYQAAIDAECHTVCVDGQPRMSRQVHQMFQLYGRYSVILLDAPREVLMQRAHARDGDDPAKLDLSMQRLTNDYAQLLSVLGVLLVGRRFLLDVGRVDTTDENWIDGAHWYINRPGNIS